MRGGEKETPEQKTERKKIEDERKAKRIEKETPEEKIIREEIEEERKNEAKDILEYLKKYSKINGKINENFIKKNIENDEKYNEYMIEKCGDKIKDKYELDNKSVLLFNNEFLSSPPRKYPLVYLTYSKREKGKEIKYTILKDELPLIWPWDWDEYLPSYEEFMSEVNKNDSGSDPMPDTMPDEYMDENDENEE